MVNIRGRGRGMYDISECPHSYRKKKRKIERGRDHKLGVSECDRKVGEKNDAVDEKLQERVASDLQ